MTRIRKDHILTQLLSEKAEKKYRGKHVAICDGEVYLLPEDDSASRTFLNTLIAKHPKSTPTIMFVPREGTYILALFK